jgi:hypothetical protein
MNMKFSGCILSLLLFVSAARAQVLFVLTSARQIGTATNEMSFDGSLINTGSTNVYLNDIQCVLYPPESSALVADTNAFFANVPGILLPGETYTDVVFGVTLGAVAPPGDYYGTVTIFGGTNIFAASNLAGASFQITLPDSVGDGIPDWWRQLYFGGDGSSTNSQSCATCDADGTGQDNQFKYVVGLNPTNSASVFAFTITNSLPPALSFGPVAAGRVVTPQFIDDFANGPWQALTAPIMAQTNGSQFNIIDPDPSPFQRFYRMQIGFP